jgi:sugar phosphate isomerase/epimerase
VIYPGLVSVTFRNLQAERVVDLAVRAGLRGIEWGGDTHVPHGDLKRAAEVRQMTESAGLMTAAYGSYYRTGVGDEKSGSFADIVETAVQLGTQTIRVWAGNRASCDADEAWRERVVSDARRIAAIAEQRGIIVAFEYHMRTLTDTPESTQSLMRMIDHPNIRTYWQCAIDQDHESRLNSLSIVAPWLHHVHVTHKVGGERRPLLEVRGDWRRYMDILTNLPGDRYAMLEFVMDESEQQYLQDAQTLKQLL